MTSPFLKKPSPAARAAAKKSATTVEPKKPPAKATSPKGASLYKAMLADLERSGLTEKDARMMRLTPYAAGEIADLYPVGDGYLIPYFTVSGAPRDNMYRYRFLGDPRSKGFSRLGNLKARRYTQPAGTPPEVYWPPFTSWLDIIASPDIPLVITEGEKKAAIATRAGAPCIGLGGVWSFRSKSLGVHLLPELKNVIWAERQVYIAYDSDAVLNKDVCLAETALAETLIREGAVVTLVRLPELVEGQKCGLDDYIVSETLDRFMDLCKGTSSFEMGRELHKLNTEVIYVQNPGVVYVRATGQPVRANDFVAHRYADRHYTRTTTGAKGMEKMELRQTAPDWLKWPQRAVASRFVFSPAEDEITEARELNLWKGWPYIPVKGDVKPWTDLLDYLFKDADESRSYMEQWAAYPFQHPGTKLRNAVAIWGVRKGTGKSLVGYTLGDLYGDAFVEIDDSHIDGSNGFNEWAKHRHFVLGDEITGNDSRRVANRIKAMITRERVEINIKNIPQYSVADCINYYFTANGPDCFYLEEDDRRIFIHEVIGTPLSDEFYAKYDKWRRSEKGRQALMWHLLYGVDTTDFNPMARPPDTQAKAEMIASTRTELEDWLSQLRTHPEIITDKFNKSDLLTINELCVLYEGEGFKRASPMLMARKLKEIGINTLYPSDAAASNQVFAGGKLFRFIAVRNQERWAKASTADIRNAYEKSRGMKPTKK